MSNDPQPSAASDEALWLAVVREKVRAIRFGSVQITVHDGRVTQIEANEKTRIGQDRPDSRSRPSGS